MLQGGAWPEQMRLQCVWFDMRLQLVCFAYGLHIIELLRRDQSRLLRRQHSESICLPRLGTYVVPLQSLLTNSTAADAGDNSMRMDTLTVQKIAYCLS